MKKGSLIILSIVTILALIVWFSCNPMNVQDKKTLTFNVLDETDLIRATGDNGCIGFGNETTGGAGGPTTTVTTWAALKAAIAGTSPKIVIISGTITGSGVCAPGPNTTIMGADANAKLIGSTIYISTADYDNFNIIIQNLTIQKPGTDGVTIAEGGHHVWVDHCTFIDCPDGSIDVTKESAYVTVSWCKFIYPSKGTHAFANLVSANDSDNCPFYVTYHHNWWSDNTIERMPSVRFGTVHVFNNYYNAPGNNYCIRTRINAQILAENNYFENVKNPWERYITTGTPGKLHLSGNITVNCTFVPGTDGEDNVSEIPDGTDTVFTPPYSYTLENASTVKASVMAGAGPH
jgi:pectate lyase